MMRRIAVVGDALQDGGAILPYSGPACSFGDAGHQAALIGGQAYCEACKSVGAIVKAGGPRRIQFMSGVALDGDKVLCKCPRPQRIVAVLAGSAWHDDGGGGEQAFRPTSPDFSHMAAATAAAANSSVHDELAHLTSPHLEGVPYYIQTTDGRVFSGRIPASGQLPRVTTEGEDAYTVFWGDEALARQKEEQA